MSYLLDNECCDGNHEDFVVVNVCPTHGPRGEYTITWCGDEIPRLCSICRSFLDREMV